MTLPAQYLADKSSLARLRHPAVAARLDPLISAGLVATCVIVDLEVLYSTRSAREWDEIRNDRLLAYPNVPVDETACQRAIEVQGLLWRDGRVRAAGIADLLLAAVAEQAELTVLHYDADYDQIAAVTAQPCEWVVPAGTVD